MLYRQIEGIDFKVPMVTFGGASLSGEGGGYGFGSMSEAEAEKLIKEAFSFGITLFDTAPIYGFGVSEERLGKFLPPDAQVITKSGVDWHENKRVNMTNSSAVTEKMLHESLKRLRRECIDLYMIHWPDTKVDIREPLSVLKRAQEQGKIKYIGLCNTNPEDLTKAQEVSSIVALQSELNLFNQKSFSHLDQSWKSLLSMGWGTFDKGILTGRVTRDRKFSEEDCRSWAPWWNKKEVRDKIQKVEKLSAILADYNVSLEDFCIQYCLYYFGISTSLIGFKTVGDIVKVTSSLQQKLMRERIEEVLIRWKTCS